MQDLAQRIKTEASQLGFDAVGITSTEPLKSDALNLNQVIRQGKHGTMAWLADTQKQRPNPKSFFSEAQSVIMVALNYYRKNEVMVMPPGSGTISIYARGRDYHKVVRNKLKRLLEGINNLEPKTRGRIFVDSFPIMEKPLAMRAGIGWIARNTTLIIKAKGSYFFLGGILTNLPLPFDEALTKDYCGACKKCQDACPTNAIIQPFQLDASRCISYLTIEHRGNVKDSFHEKIGNYLFGCDICQMVCPWNIKYAQNTLVSGFNSRFRSEQLSLYHLEKLSKTQFKKMFEGTAVRRLGFERFRRNLKTAKNNIKRSSE